VPDPSGARPIGKREEWDSALRWGVGVVFLGGTPGKDARAGNGPPDFGAGGGSDAVIQKGRQRSSAMTALSEQALRRPLHIRPERERGQNRSRPEAN